MRKENLENMEIVYYRLSLANSEEKKKVNEIFEWIESDPNRPEGVKELLNHLVMNSYAESYQNNRLIWLGYKLEKKGIESTLALRATSGCPCMTRGTDGAAPPFM